MIQKEIDFKRKEALKKIYEDALKAKEEDDERIK